MSFKKFAKVPVIAIAEGEFDTSLTFKKSASNSYYAANSGKLNVRAILEQVASEYNISANPKDYIFEAVRAVTADVPNQNADAFPKEELLRFDHRLGKAVYQTFIMKPHQVNHRADNPKTARGVVLDASYNDSSEVLPVCPDCKSKTAEAEDRDSSGLNCKKCGCCVKDEFVELLLAIDTKKDPVFAEGVRNGNLDSVSMGCFTANTEVMLGDGTTKPISAVVVGDSVRTHTGKSALVKELSVRDFDGDIIELDISGIGDIIEVTPNHPLYILDNDDVGHWMHADHVLPGMRVLSPKLLPNEDSSGIDVKFARLAGYFVTEGNFIKAYEGKYAGQRVGIEFTFGSGEQRYINEVKSLLTYFGASPSIYIRDDRNTITIKAYRCVDLANKLYDFAGEHAKNKILSESVFNMSDEAKLAFLGSVINGDGTCCTRSKKNGRKRTTITTISHKFARQLSALFASVGIPSTIPAGTITSGFGSKNSVYRIEVSGRPQNLLSKVSNKVTEYKLSSPKYSVQHSVGINDGIVREIRSVNRKPFVGKVYNFEVDTVDHSYIAGGIAVHNCEALYTDCSICNNRARTVAQFCAHIKSGNKKKIFKTAAGDKMSYEKCGGVIFTEISRVDQPADPTATQREIFDISGLSMQAESEMLVLASRVAKLESLKTAVTQDELLKLAQLADDIKRQMDELKGTNPQLHEQLSKSLNPAMGVPAEMSIGDYAKKLEESQDQNVTPDEMGIKVEEVGQAPMTVKSTKVLDRVAGELEAMMDSIEENDTVSANTHKFADSYKNLEATVTKSGNVKVFTKDGTLFVIRPETKPADEAAAQKLATEILTSVADNGIVATVNKYKTVVGPKMAQVLEMHIEDFAGGREEGDKMSAPEGGDDDKAQEMAKAEDSQVGEEHSDRKDMVRDQRDQSNADVLEGHEPDHKEKLDGFNGPTEEDNTDMAQKRDNKPKSMLDDVQLDMKKAEKVVEKTAADKCALGALCKDDSCMEHGKKAQEDAPAMPMIASNDSELVKEAAQKHVTRVERLYKSRLEAAAADAATKVAEAEKAATVKVQEKLLRALKLASKRQVLNLEPSPLKAAMFDTLLSEVDVDSESYYPGMDPVTASVLVESTTMNGVDAFVESLVKRATEFLSMSDETFSAIEADIKNLQPAPVSVPEVMNRKASAQDTLRKQASAGNLDLAPSPTEEIISDDGKRDSIRSALGSTKVRRASKTLITK